MKKVVQFWVAPEQQFMYALDEDGAFWRAPLPTGTDLTLKWVPLPNAAPPALKAV